MTLPQLEKTDAVIPLFIDKTFNILEEGKFSEIIDWNKEGSALEIKKPKEFCKKVLPLYFKHKNLTSFIRQLNMYNFHKRRTLELEHIYEHEFFQRGKRHLLKEVKRKKHESSLNLQKTLEALENLQNTQGNTESSCENEIIAKMNRKTLLTIDNLEKKINNLTDENQTLWTKICSQNEREEFLKYVLMNLMQQFGIGQSEIPIMIKKDPNLFAPVSKEEKDIVLKQLYSEDFLKALQKQENLPSKDFSDSKTNPVTSDGFKKQSNQANRSKKLNKEENQHTLSGKNWNLETEYFKSLFNTNKIFQSQDETNYNGKSLLNKRPLNFDNEDKQIGGLFNSELYKEFENQDLPVAKKVFPALEKKDSIMTENSQTPQFTQSQSLDLTDFNLG